MLNAEVAAVLPDPASQPVYPNHAPPSSRALHLGRAMA